MEVREQQGTSQLVKVNAITGKSEPLYDVDKVRYFCFVLLLGLYADIFALSSRCNPNLLVLCICVCCRFVAHLLVLMGLMKNTPR